MCGDVCVCERERERVCVRERERGQETVCKRMCVFMCDRENVCVFTPSWHGSLAMLCCKPHDTNVYNQSCLIDWWRRRGQRDEGQNKTNYTEEVIR